MKRILATSLLLATLSAGTATAQISLVNPVPQKVTASGKGIVTAPAAWRVICDKNRTGSIAEQALVKATTVKQQPKAAYSVTIGVKGDKAVSKVAKLIPAKAEGYYLSITDKGAVVAGADEEGLYYGVQTLLASVAEGKLECCTITDWPDVPFRGTVEGFYGTPWSHKARLSQIEFYGRNKMNVYIYGPKDDPYHRNHWRVPYPDEEARRIQELNEHAKQCGVNFYWAILGADAMNETDHCVLDIMTHKH